MKRYRLDVHYRSKSMILAIYSCTLGSFSLDYRILGRSSTQGAFNANSSEFYRKHQ